MLILSLFPGIDLLGHAFELEWPEACVVRGPDLIFGSLSDIRTFHPPTGKFSGIIGGPPCQAFSSLVHLVRANGNEPKFGNLIPEFERCITEAQPAWFLMEEVRGAPIPAVPGYGVHSFLLDNSNVGGTDGWGQEQIRVRRFTFGLRGREPVNLMRWIQEAALLLPRAEGTLTTSPVDNSAEAKGRTRTTAVNAGHSDPNESLTHARRVRRQEKTCVSRPGLEVVGKYGKVKRKEIAREKQTRKTACTSSDGGPSVRMSRYRLEDALRLQGLPEDFLADCPLTAEGKLKAVANGVSLFTGRAIARAVKESAGG